MSPVTPHDVLDLWFSERVRPLWFNATPAFDQELRERFEPTWQQARDGELIHWSYAPSGALALTIVLDQLPLNMFRGQPVCFSTEAQAREVARQAIALGWDQGLSDEQKAFLYLPFMHSEALADQERSVALFEAAGLEHNLRWARHHRDLIRRFGRFPHRNAILGRASSAEETVYLQSDEAFHG